MLRRIARSRRCCLVAAGFVAGLVVTGPDAQRRRGSARRALAAGAQPRRPTSGRRARAAAAALAPPARRDRISRASPARRVKGVANISSLQVVRTPNSPFGNDPFFRYFFGDDDAFGSRDRRSLSLGSGVIISADGYVVTNNHVVGEQRARDHDRAARQARDQGHGDRHRSDDRHRAAEDSTSPACRSCRGAIRASSRSANGCWRSAARSS